MSGRRLTALALAGSVLALGGCEGEAPAPKPIAREPAMASTPVLADSPPRLHEAEVTPTPAVPLDVALIRREWRKAENREQCAPLAFTSVGGGSGTARRANFAGGWAVAYDQPGLRSAYGLAGPGLVKEDEAPVPDQRARLARQWPLFRDLANLPEPSFAGYGIEGAGAYPAENSDGHGFNSLAYVRVGDQTCTYNVWSRLGRAHLEHLLERLTLVDP